MSDSDYFGFVLSFDDVEDWVEATLQLWQETYLAELERRRGIPVRGLPKIASWNRFNEFERFPENALPAVVIEAPGLVGPPTKEGDGRYSATIAVFLDIVVKASTKKAARELVKVYAAAFRSLLLQHPSLGGHAEAVEWMDERYDSVVETEDERTMNGVQLAFAVSVRGIASAMSGPRTVPADPYADPGDMPVVLTTDLQVDREPL